VPLLQKIEEDFKVALKHSDKLRVSVLRLIKAAIKNKQIENPLNSFQKEVDGISLKRKNKNLR
jgi:uncharacterized protein YqeY